MNQPQLQEESIDLKKIFFRYLPYWYVFAISCVIAVAVAYLVNRLSQPVYRVQTTVLISDKSKSGAAMGAFMGELDMFGSRSNFHDQLVIMTSYALVDSTLQNLNLNVSYFSTNRFMGFGSRQELFKEAPFRVIWDPSIPQLTEEPFQVRIIDEQTFQLEGPDSRFGLFSTADAKRFGEVISGEGFQFVVQRTKAFDPEQDNDYLFIMRDPLKLVSEYAKATRAEPLNRDAWVLRISYESTHLQRGLDYLNSLTGNFIQQGLGEKNKIAGNTLRFIDEQIVITTDSLNIAESNLQSFRQDRQLMDVSSLATQLLNDLQSLDQQMAIEKVKQQYYDYLKDYLTEDKDFAEVFGPSAIGIEDPLLNALITEISKLYAERGRMMLSTTELSPQILSVDQRISQARRSLEENITSIGRASQILLADLNQRIRQIEVRIRQLPQTERELIGIQRQFNLNDATFNYLLEKRAEAGIAMASNIADNRVIDSARFEALVAPRKMLNYAIALSLGFMFPMALLIIRAFFNTRIMDKSEVIETIDFPILGIIPRDEKASANGAISLVISANAPNIAIIEAFRSMRSNLQFFAPKELHKVIAVSSTESGEGKSFSAINLAMVLAMANKKTILIGADMRKPRIAETLGLASEPGLSNFLIGTNTLQEVIQQSGYNKDLSVITAGHLPPNPTELLESDTMDDLLKHLKEEYDFVVIDTAPVGLVSDALGLIKKADVNLYVIRMEYTQRSAMEFIHEIVNKTRISNICIEINDVKMKGGGGYGYGYGYGYGETATKKKASWLGFLSK